MIAHDAQLEDDARLVVGLARTAALHGARILTRVSAMQVSGDGARLRDELTGAEFDVSARAVVNATGVWAGETTPDIRLRPSRGTHLVVPLDRLGGLNGQLIVPVPGESGRWVFAIAQRTGVAYVGLTDEEQPGPIPDVQTAPESDIMFLLDTLNATLATPLTRADVVGTYAGLRPLVESDDARTADVSRRHATIRHGGGLVSIVGGKLTTYRRMAQDAVDAAVEAGGLQDIAGDCHTRDLPLVGAAPRAQLAHIDAPRRVVDRHGTLAPEVLELAPGRPVAAAAGPAPPRRPARRGPLRGRLRGRARRRRHPRPPHPDRPGRRRSAQRSSSRGGVARRKWSSFRSVTDATTEAILDATRASVLDFGIRRTTLTDVARRAGVSRMTVYRRYPDVDAVLRDLMTREFGAAMAEVAKDLPGDDGRERVLGHIMASVDVFRGSPLMSKIIEAEPELLLPYVLGRMGETQRAAVGLLIAEIADGQRDGSIRPGDVRVMAQALLLVAQSFILSGSIAEDVSPTALREELERIIAAVLTP